MSVRNSAFVQEAKSGERVTRWFLAIPIFLVFFMVNLGAALGLGTVWKVEPGSGWAQVQEGVTDLVPILLVFAWVALFERRRISSLGFRRPQRGVLTLLLGVVVGLAMISVPILILLAAGVYRGAMPPPGSSAGFSAVPIVLLLALTVIIQGSNEEILVRGFLFQSLGLQMPGWLAVVIPTLLFTVVHGVAGAPITFTTIFFYGRFAILVALERQSLWLICGIHARWNWALGNIFGLAVSGLPPRANAVFFLEATPGQPDWLTGGAWGTEGSLVASLMIIIATVLVFTAWRRRDKAQPEISTGQSSTSTARTSPSAEATDA